MRPGHQRRLRERHDHAEEEDQRRRDRAADFVEAPHRSQDAARLLVHLDFRHVLLQRCRDLRPQLLEDHLAEISAGHLQENDHRRVHHRFEDLDRLVAQPALEHGRRDLRDTLARQNAPNRQDRREQAGNQERDRTGEQAEDDQTLRLAEHVCRHDARERGVRQHVQLRARGSGFGVRGSGFGSEIRDRDQG